MTQAIRQRAKSGNNRLTAWETFWTWALQGISLAER